MSNQSLGIVCLQDWSENRSVGWIVSLWDNDLNRRSLFFASVDNIVDFLCSICTTKDGLERIFIPGTYRNSLLISRLARCASDQVLEKLYLARPYSLEQCLSDPARIFSSANCPPSLGGPQQLQRSHYAVFALADLFWRFLQGKVSLAVLRSESIELYADHPLRSLTSFFQPGCAVSHALLLGMIRDPRWVPGSRKGVYQYERLCAVAHPFYVDLLLHPDKRHDLRSIICLRCWLGDCGFDERTWKFNGLKALVDSIQRYSIAPPSVMINDIIRERQLSSTHLYSHTLIFLDMFCDYWMGTITGRMDEFFWPTKYSVFDNQKEAVQALRFHLSLITR